MPSKAEAEAAISSLNLRDLKGRTINVTEGHPHTDRPRTGGFGAGPFYLCSKNKILALS
jgi:hypothetical protein